MITIIMQKAQIMKDITCGVANGIEYGNTHIKNGSEQIPMIMNIISIK